jgi:glycosyltransferase involved in cell wall biosynthesis
MAKLVNGFRQRVSTTRLAIEGRAAHRRQQPRVLATVCWNFPIYSQTFVYEELTQLLRLGLELRHVYSLLDPRDQLPTRFTRLWDLKRRLYLNRELHEEDFAWYRRRAPAKVEALVEKLSQASGLSHQAVLSHDNFLQGFSLARMAEAYRANYLHSYFFYDRSLMALIAGYMLDIPRGISCYADHLLKDYELKVVPLHLELCSIVIATSEGIRRELLEIAPSADPQRVLVKPNGIDSERFPFVERSQPAIGEPFRLVCVCRIEPKKGLLDLVEAVHLLRQRGVAVNAHIVGAADDWSAASRQYQQDLEDRITELDLSRVVRLEGRQNLEGVLRFLGVAHLFVAPFVVTEAGDKDGIPTAVLEGMATGIAVVASDAGSIPEVVESGRNGIVVPQRQPAAIADAIESLLRDPEGRQRLGSNAAADVRSRFDVRSCEEVFHRKLQALLQAR